jgi:uncharacterized protein
VLLELVGAWRRHTGFIGRWDNRSGVFHGGALLFRGLSGSRVVVDRENLMRVMGRRCAMSKQHFYFKLIPPRVTFGADMTAEERALMMEQVRYTREAFDAGKILIYGPVMASAGAFGFAVLEMEDAAEVQKFGDEDPSVKAGMNKFEFYPMKIGAARGLA